MKKREPKPMKPVRAWAIVMRDSGEMIDQYTSRELARKYASRHHGERIARVVITELRGKR